MGRPPFKRVGYTEVPIKYLRIAIVACVEMLMYVGLTKIRSGSILVWRLQSPRTRHHTFNDNCIDGQFLKNNTTRRRYRFIILQWHHICAMASQISINSTLCSTAFSGLQQRSHLCSARSRVHVSGYHQLFFISTDYCNFLLSDWSSSFQFKGLLSFTVITINGRQADMFTINQRWLSIITLIPVIRQTTKENIIWSWN